MLIDNYNELYRKIKLLTDSIAESEFMMQSAGSRRDTEIPARIENLEEQLKKIDDYLLKIEAFRQIAENHIESRNLLTIEAQPGYRVNLNRLRNWAMMIDPMSTNDPYAQRVYLTAKCDEHFLKSKKTEFSERIEFLKGGESSAISAETEQAKAKITQAKARVTEMAGSPEVAAFAGLVGQENTRHWFETAPEVFSSPDKTAPVLAMGAYAAPLGFPEENRPQLKQLFGKFYDESSGRVLLPVEVPTDREYAVSVTCTPARAKQLDRGLQNLILSVVNGNPAGDHKVYVIDAVRFSSAVLGSLKQLEDTFAIERLPRNPEQVGALLERIVSGFSDMDDMLELYDSVIEYNLEAEPAKRLPRSTLILFGWPNAFGAEEREHLQRIMTNYERYGISFISVTLGSGDNRQEAGKSLPEYAAHNAMYITMKPKETTIGIGDGAPSGFTWYVFKSELPESYVESIKQVKIIKTSLGNKYTERYDLGGMPEYTREYKGLELPYGVDAKDMTHAMSFERENFAAYLVGASGSGKSTLLHTLITGIIRNYHPDNVELWLADFKQLEFKKYIEHNPPHIKYILLDESTELVYDLIDRVNEKMMERQRVFARIGKDKLSDVDPRDLDEPMPIIFIILDEFSVMSQAISESPMYKLKLQNVLAKGRALGIKFLFASQTFTKGIAGLTLTAKDQIQQRISMKGTREEISETLELSVNLKTDQVRNWMDALPPFYALVKQSTGPDTPPEVIRVNVLWVSDENKRDDMIDRINSTMTASEKYSPNVINTYVSKNPVLVDGNTFDAFSTQDLERHIESLKPAGKTHSGDDVFVTFGTPRLMEKIKTAVLTPETRENILLIGRDGEQACTAAILTSVMKSFILQGQKVRVWAYGKNRLLTAYRADPWGTDGFSGVWFVEGIDRVCDEIRALKDDIRNKKASNELIVLLGIDRICSDFDFIDNASGASASDEETIAAARAAREKEAVRSGAVAATDYDKAYDEWSKKQYLAWSRAKKEATAAGLSKDEIRSAGEKANKEYSEMYPAPKKEDFASGEVSLLPEHDSIEATLAAGDGKGITQGAYNALEDFQYVVKQGSRLGYHFMLCLNTYADLKTTTLKVDLFRHRMSFQVSADDSRELFGNRNASALPERICQYHDTIEGYSFRPYMHNGIVWDGWEVDENGRAVDPNKPQED